MAWMLTRVDMFCLILCEPAGIVIAVVATAHGQSEFIVATTSATAQPPPPPPLHRLKDASVLYLRLI